MYACMHTYIHTEIPMYLYFYLSTYPSIYFPAYLSTYYLSIHLSISIGVSILRLSQKRVPIQQDESEKQLDTDSPWQEKRRIPEAFGLFVAACLVRYGSFSKKSGT